MNERSVVKAQATPNGSDHKPGNGPALSCDELSRRIGELRRAVHTLEELEAAGVADTGVGFARQALARLEQQTAQCAAPNPGRNGQASSSSENPGPGKPETSMSAEGTRQQPAVAG